MNGTIDGITMAESGVEVEFTLSDSDEANVERIAGYGTWNELESTPSENGEADIEGIADIQTRDELESTLAENSKTGVERVAQSGTRNELEPTSSQNGEAISEAVAGTGERDMVQQPRDTVIMGNGKSAADKARDLLERANEKKREWEEAVALAQAAMSVAMAVGVSAPTTSGQIQPRADEGDEEELNVEEEQDENDDWFAVSLVTAILLIIARYDRAVAQLRAALSASALHQPLTAAGVAVGCALSLKLALAFARLGIGNCCWITISVCNHDVQKL